MKKLIKFFKDEEGATAIEYALIATLISMVGVAVWTLTGNGITATFTTVAGVLGS